MEGITIAIRTPRVVPMGSEVYRVISEGNIRAMQTFFTKGLASPFDVNPFGQSYLAVCQPVYTYSMTLTMALVCHRFKTGSDDQVSPGAKR